MPTKSSPTLGAEQALSLVSDQWFIQVMHALMSGPKRHSQMLRSISGVTQKMLTQTLRKMERDGLIKRSVYDVLPKHTEYSLTELGESIVSVLQGLCRWGQANFAQVEANRRAYDSGSTEAITGEKLAS